MIVHADREPAHLGRLLLRQTAESRDDHDKDKTRREDLELY
jgi:hypothetical protein